jgi:uncharacterized membrane protein YjjP (DUF1212 family)
LITYRAIAATFSTEGRSFTAIKPIANHGVDLNLECSVVQYLMRFDKEKTSAETVYSEIQKLLESSEHYPIWLIVMFVGIACGAFAAIMDGDVVAVIIAGFAAAIGLFAKHVASKKGINAYLSWMFAAFVSGLLSGNAYIAQLSDTPALTLAASVLYLIPGVPMINTIQDAMSGDMTVASGRAMESISLVLALTVGLVLSLELSGVLR